MGTRKKDHQTDASEEEQPVCRFAHWSFPSTNLLSIPGLSLSLHTRCPHFPDELSFFPLIHSGSLHWSGVWISLPFVPTESIRRHYNFSLTLIKLGWWSPCPYPTTTLGILICRKPRSVAVPLILHPHYSYPLSVKGLVEWTPRLFKSFYSLP